MHLLTSLLVLLLSVAVREEALDLQQPAEVIATVTASCTGCSWAVPGREGVVLVLEVDGRYSQHLVLVRGEKMADYSVFLGHIPAGAHRLAIKRDSRSSSKGVGAPVVESITFRSVNPHDADH